jgi:putative membrane protein
MTTAGGMWVDSAGGTWMDTTGAMWMGHRERAIGLQPADVAAMTNANVAAHLSTGDSLEIALSESGAGRAQNADVKAFAQRMVTEHTAHRQKGATVATESSITPAPSPADTLDVTMAREMVQRLSSRAAGSDYDRQLMRDEVMMHRHMLHDLEAVRPQTSGAMQQFVDETIPVVQQHLRDAEAIRARLGDRSGGTP